MNVTFEPIGLWPGGNDPAQMRDDYRRSRWSFKAGYADTLHLLERELDKLGAHQVVIQLALDASEIRRDGMPRASANPRHPGVVINFASTHGPLRYFTDEFVLWQHNVRAIALGLEALRKVDRYGITKRGEQYAGSRALPAGDGPSAERGRALIAEHGSVRDALMATHPDRGGNDRDFNDVQAARDATA